MEGSRGGWIAPIMVMVMLIFSSLIAMGGASSEAPRAAAVTGYRQILFIYDNTTLAEEWKEYLNREGYNLVNFIPYNMTRNVQYNNYGLVIIGTDSNYLNSDNFNIIMRLHIPVLGVGYGGLLAYMSLGHNGFYAQISTDKLDVEKNLSMYNIPARINGVPGTLTLFDTAAPSIYMGYRYEASLKKNESLCIGFYHNNNDYAPIIQIKNFLLFGYAQSPIHLTNDGRKLLGNLIHYIHYYYGTNLWIRKAPFKLNIDGDPTLREWFTARKVYLNGNHNFVAMLEDRDYLYVWCHSDNSTASSSEYIAVWFERDNNRTVGVDKSVFYVLFQEYHGLSYREVIGYNSWDSTFKSFDNVNFTGSTRFTSSYMDAEIRISKKYLGIAPGTRNIMGFGAMYRYNGVLGSYPSTFDWEDAQTAITVYAEEDWTGELEYLNSKGGCTPTIDGVLDFQEWSRASTYSLYTYYSGDPYSISVCHDSNNIYIGGYIPNMTGSYSTIYFYFDTYGDGGTAPNTDDFEIWGGKSSTGTFSASEHYGTGTGWGPVQALTDATMKFSMKADHVYFELRMSFSKLRVTPGTFREINMQIAINMGGSINRLPRTAQHTVPDTWTLVLYSQAFWGPARTTLDAREDYPVDIDGDLYEWDDSSFFCQYPTPSGKDVTVLVKTYQEHLIIGLRYQNPLDTGYTNFQIGFDVGYNGGVPESRDFVIVIYHNTGMKEYRGNSTSGWWDEVTPSGWTYAMDNTSSGWTVEISIDYDKLDITPGVASRIGFIVFLSEDNVGYSYFPAQSMFENLSTWNTITSSDNWESVAIPEFGALGIVGVGMVIAAVVLLRRRRT